LSYESVGDNGGELDNILAGKLSGCKPSSGHDSFLKGIVVHAEFTATHDFILQLYRYSFRDTASSTSKMHSVNKGNIADKCSKWVMWDTIDEVNRLITAHNESKDDTTISENLNSQGVSKGHRYKGNVAPKTKKELFEAIIHNVPLGYELTFGEVTNYLQLKTMYKQRKSHKMSGWSDTFVKWVKTLPMSHLITGEKE
jgi:hypothetical protein